MKFKNYGIDLIEVTDDGSGISTDDYEGIGTLAFFSEVHPPGLKHYTSKLSTFENLDELKTFGFRGEALSSLCALADIQIVTATREQAPRATKLEFDHTGTIVSKKVASAKVSSNSTHIFLTIAWNNCFSSKFIFNTPCETERIFKERKTGICQGDHYSPRICVDLYECQDICIPTTT